MAEATENPTDPWRVVVFTNVPGGVVYRLAAGVLGELDPGHRVVAVVTSPGPPRRRSDAFLSVAAAVPPEVYVLVSNHPSRLAAMLAPLRPDLIVCGGFPWKIPAEVLALPRLGAVNLHPAALPKYRGPSSVEWALRNGDPELGFTVHRIDGGFDTGAILAQGSVPIADEDDLGTLMGKLEPLLPQVLRRALERVARGEPGEPQDEALASYAGFFEPEWRTIDWAAPARTVHNQVRSWIGFRDIPRGRSGPSPANRC